MAPPDFVALARSEKRAAYVSRFRERLFLVGAPPLNEPIGPQRTLVNVHAVVEKDGQVSFTPTGNTPIDPNAPRERFVVRPIEKTQTAFPAMITVGRASNNDIVLRDVQVSKFHAWFRLIDGRNDALELCDADSRNGTFVGPTRIAAKTPTEVRPGTRLRFGRVALLLTDAAGCWDEIHNG